MSSLTPRPSVFTHLGKALLASVALWATLPAPSPAQDLSGRVVIYGRVEDAVTEEAVGGSFVVAGDSTWAVTADSLGNFAIPVDRSPPYMVIVEQLGYEPTVFELPDSAQSMLTVVRIEPAPIEIDGVTVVDESQLAAFTIRLEARRSGYTGSVRVFDRARLLIDGAESALQLVQRRYPDTRPCETFGADGAPYELNQLCRTSRGRVGEMLICLDDRQSPLHVVDLEALPVGEIALAEFYGATVGLGLYRGGRALGAPGTTFISTGRSYDVGQVRLYTPLWMARSAALSSALIPLGFGC